MAIGINKSGLERHYEHIQRIRKEHGAIPAIAVREIGNRTLREAKMLAKISVNKGAHSGAYRRSINMQVLKQGKNDVAVIGSHMEYAPYLEEGTRPHIIRPKNGKALAWKSTRAVVKEFRGKGAKKSSGGEYQKSSRWMMFAKYVKHPGTKAKWILRDAILNIAPFHVPIIMKYLSAPSKP